MADARAQRQQLRTLLCRRRAALGPDEAAEQAQAVVRRLLVHPLLQQAGCIASYCSCRGELDTAQLNAALLRRGQQVALPVITDLRRCQMSFYLITDQSSLACNAFGIPEPLPDPRQLVPISRLSALLIPLVAFNCQGQRLGMGKGFYDRLLPGLAPSCLTLGLAYDFQEIPALAAQPWDWPLQEIITPTRRVRCMQHHAPGPA